MDEPRPDDPAAPPSPPRYSSELQDLPPLPVDGEEAADPAAGLPAFLGQAFVRTDVPGVAKADRMREMERVGPTHDTRFGIVGGRIEPPPSFTLGGDSSAKGGRASSPRAASRSPSPDSMRPYWQVASSDEDEEEAQ